MKIDVYDTYVRTRDGALLHFDVFIPEGTSDAIRFAKQWLHEMGISYDKIEQENCQFCHSEIPDPEVIQQINHIGYYILQMEGCPSPV